MELLYVTEAVKLQDEVYAFKDLPPNGLNAFRAPAPGQSAGHAGASHGSGTDEVRSNDWSPPGTNARTQDTAVSLFCPSFRTEAIDGPGAVIAVVGAHNVESEQSRKCWRQPLHRTHRGWGRWGAPPWAPGTWYAAWTPSVSRTRPGAAAGATVASFPPVCPREPTMERFVLTSCEAHGGERFDSQTLEDQRAS